MFNPTPIDKINELQNSKTACKEIIKHFFPLTKGNEIKQNPKK